MTKRSLGTSLDWRRTDRRTAVVKCDLLQWVRITNNHRGSLVTATRVFIRGAAGHSVCFFVTSHARTHTRTRWRLTSRCGWADGPRATHPADWLAGNSFDAVIVLVVSSSSDQSVPGPPVRFFVRPDERPGRPADGRSVGRPAGHLPVPVPVSVSSPLPEPVRRLLRVATTLILRLGHN